MTENEFFTNIQVYPTYFDSVINMSENRNAKYNRYTGMYYIHTVPCKKTRLFPDTIWKSAVALVIAKIQKCAIPHLKALKVISSFQCQKFRKL